MKRNYNTKKDFYRSFALVGCIAGLIAVTMYFLSKITSLPDGIYYGLHTYQGPIMIIAWMGMYAFFRLRGQSIALVTAVIFAICSAISRMMFLIVQINNRVLIGEYKDADSLEFQENWTLILKGVLTVQNGLNITSDIFLDLAIILFGVVCWNYHRIGKFLAVYAFVSGGLHFIFKAYTFPKAPASEGLFDAGPLVAVWGAMIGIWIFIILFREKNIPGINSQINVI